MDLPVKQKLRGDAVIEIPSEVAVCPICKSKLYASFDDWIEENGQWAAASLNLDCETEPDIDSPEWWDWLSGHYSMPYVDWLPVHVIVTKWINENYCFDLEEANR